MKDLSITNKWLKIYLENAGYKYRGTTYVEHEGDTFSYIKTLEDVDLFFSWHWEQELKKIYWSGKLVAYYNFEPDNINLHPMGLFEFNFILKENLEDLSYFENKIVEIVKNMRK